MSTPALRTPRRATGTVPGTVRASLLVVESFWVWYRRNWRSSVVSSILLPVLFLVALGFGFGSQVTPSEATLGLPYVEYLAPALLVASLTQTASFESTFPILSAFKWQQTYFAMVSTPLGPGQILSGQLAWLVARLSFAGAVFVVVATALGAITGPGIVVSLLVSVLAAMALSVPVVAYSATVEREGQQFNAIFRFIVMPMTMFAGTYFPVDQLPGWVHPLVWITPVWHGTELSRGAAFGGLDALPALGHLAYLTAMIAVGVYFARKHFVRRLGV